jgi:heme/copper-type cytochrome/quinol oxidase subunit 2
MQTKQLLVPLLTTAVMAYPATSLAGDPVVIELTLKDHKFEPAEIRAPAGQAITINLKNADASPEEFESSALRVEKIVTPNGKITIKLKPLAAGRYPFMGDYNEKTAQGVLVVE